MQAGKKRARARRQRAAALGAAQRVGEVGVADDRRERGGGEALGVGVARVEAVAAARAPARAARRRRRVGGGWAAPRATPPPPPAGRGPRARRSGAPAAGGVARAALARREHQLGEERESPQLCAARWSGTCRDAVRASTSAPARTSGAAGVFARAAPATSHRWCRQPQPRPSAASGDAPPASSAPISRADASRAAGAAAPAARPVASSGDVALLSSAIWLRSRSSASTSSVKTASSTCKEKSARAAARGARAIGRRPSQFAARLPTVKPGRAGNTAERRRRRLRGNSIGSASASWPDPPRFPRAPARRACSSTHACATPPRPLNLLRSRRREAV